MDAAVSNRDVAVVIPALNESAVIGSVISELLAYFPLVIIVDDGSDDGTRDVALASGARVIRHGLNLGQGGALATGLKGALRVNSVQWIVTFDADGQHRVEDALALLERARQGDADIVLGTRFGAGGSSEAGFVKRTLLKAAVRFTRVSTGLPLTDTHNGLRVMSRDFAEGLRITERGMGHATEILEHVSRSGARWAEVPVHIHYTEYSRSKGQPMINSVNILFDSVFR